MSENRRRHLLRRQLLMQLLEYSGWCASDLIELTSMNPTLLSSGNGIVRQVLVGDGLTINLRVERSPDQSKCPEGCVGIWITVGDGVYIEAGSLVACDDYVLIGTEIQSLGR